MKFYNALRYSYVIGLHRDENQTKNFVLCEIIFSTESKFLLENLTIDSVLHGATNVSPKLNQFFQCWICGPDSRRWRSGTKQCRIQSVSQIEAELTINATETQVETPNGISAYSKGGIGCAFENFDRFVESQSGKVTLHDPLGISYELVFPS